MSSASSATDRSEVPAVIDEHAPPHGRHVPGDRDASRARALDDLDLLTGRGLADRLNVLG